MNALEMARTAYSSTSPQSAPIRTHRGTEYEVLGRVTYRLRDCAAKQKQDYVAFVEALAANRRLWTIFASDLAGEKNQLPQQLRAQLFYLAEFTIQHTSKVLAGKADVTALIDINAAVMRGLQQKGDAA